MTYLVPKLYLNQHRVLSEIYNVPSIQEFPNIEELATSLNLSMDDVMQAAHLLKGRGFAFIHRDKRPFVVGCTPDGAQALLQKVLIEEGKEKAKANILRWTQIAGIIVASVISISTFVLNALTTVSNSRKIEVIQTELKQLKESNQTSKPAN